MINRYEVVALVAVLLLLAALWVIWRPSLRRNSRATLRPGYLLGQSPPSGMQGAFRSLGESVARAAWGSPSYTAWRRACDASTEASRARRAREER